MEHIGLLLRIASHVMYIGALKGCCLVDPFLPELVTVRTLICAENLATNGATY